MKITVKVIPNSSQEKVEKVGENEYKVWTHTKAIDGEANKKVVQLLADYFDVSKSEIELTSGATSRKKLYKIK